MGQRQKPYRQWCIVVFFHRFRLVVGFGSPGYFFWTQIAGRHKVYFMENRDDFAILHVIDGSQFLVDNLYFALTGKELDYTP